MLQIILKLMGSLFLISLFFGAFFYFFLYKAKIRDVSRLKPYVDYIDRDLKIEVDALLVEVNPNFIRSKKYLLIPKSQSDDVAQEGDVFEIKQGAVIRMNKAIHYTAPASGAKYSILLGVFTDENSNSFEFEYEWGDFSDYEQLYNKSDVVKFKNPLWETQSLKSDYKF